jgi:hypothetical protein
MSREVMQQALTELRQVMSWIDNWSPEFTFDPDWPTDNQKTNEAIAALEQELAKPEQEPVAWGFKNRHGNIVDCLPSKQKYHQIPLYTSPPRKEWVGLSVNEGRDFFESKLTRAELITEISEFLEEKNNAV